MSYDEVLGWIALALMVIALSIFVIWAILQWVNFFQVRKEDSTKIQIRLNAQTALYVLLSIAIIGGVLINIYTSIDSSYSVITIFFVAIGTFLGSIGLIAIILGVAKRWHIMGGLIFIAIGLLPFVELVTRDFADHTLVNYPLYIAVVVFVVFACLVFSGVIMVIKGNQFNSQLE
jgi:hypothetical protein